MTRILLSPLTVGLTACLMFLLTLFLLLRILPIGTVNAVVKGPLAAEDNPSWKFRNPDIDQWVSQIKEQRDALAEREQQLKDWEARLAAWDGDRIPAGRKLEHPQLREVPPRLVAGRCGWFEILVERQRGALREPARGRACHKH